MLRKVIKKGHCNRCYRCGGSSSATKTNESCEEPKEGNAECGHDEGEEHAVGREGETEKLLVENGEASKECSKDQKVEATEEEEASDKAAEIQEDKDDGAKEDEDEKEKTVKSGTDNNSDGIENAEVTEEIGEGETLIKKEEEHGKEKEKDGKKNKKKEGSSWMCGLGKKSSKEKSEKKKKEDKKGKKSKSTKVEEIEEEGLPENEKKLIDGEEDANVDAEKNEEKESDMKETDAKEEEKNEDVGQSDETGEKNEEVVVFVTESEAVVEETHHIEAGSESNDECSVKGEGLVKGKCGQEASFQIHVLAGDVFSFMCKVQDSNGNEVVVGIEQIEENIHKATYHPSTAGIHTIEALWKGQPVSGSPFQATIAEADES